jgi:hypothetical protein
MFECGLLQGVHVARIKQPRQASEPQDTQQLSDACSARCLCWHPEKAGCELAHAVNRAVLKALLQVVT